MVVGILLVAFVIAVAVFLIYMSPEFRLTIRNGKVRKRCGSAPLRFIQDVQDIITETGIKHGSIRAESAAGRIHLQFSHSIPEGCRQRIRNVWRLYR